MSIYIQLLFVAAVVIFIVDLSGFTDTLLDIASNIRKARVESLRPFSCSLCMTWWCCLAWSLIVGEFSLPVVAYCAGLSAMSFPISQFFIFIREGLNRLVAVLAKLLGI